MKKTAVAPSNIAFTKYWGKKDEDLRIPENGSISMNLSNLLTTTTVEFSDTYKEDEVTIYSSSKNSLVSSRAERGDLKRLLLRHLADRNDSSSRVMQHLNRIRKLANIPTYAKVVSKNNFPTGTGLSSSASGFAALTVAAASAAGLDLSEKELSTLARLGSGSACRSIPSGFVEWLDGNTHETSYAVQIFPKDYFSIVDVVAVVSSEKKDVPTSIGQKTASSSPFMHARLSRMKEKNEIIKTLIKNRDFQKFGELIEQEALELHAIMLTQTPPLIYWLPGTITVMKAVQKWRREGLNVYFTINTGQDVHLICQEKDREKVASLAKELSVVRDVIINAPAHGTRLIENHLF